MQRIGIMGGTFNPPHKGHIAIAEAAQKFYLLDKVIFVPSGHPPHKTHEFIADKEDRYKMVKLAIKGHKHFSPSRVEIDRPGYSYAVDTFNDLKKEYKGNALLYYIMGMDSINEILSWKKPLELFKICQFIVATRPGARIRTLKRLLKFPPLKLHAGQIHVIEVKKNISATKIRESIKKGNIPARLLDNKVAGYIRKKKLYGYTGI
jgi:nicotinate-nucleotide adenylyltransferase